MNITVLAALSKTGDQAEIQRIKDAHAALQHQLSTQSSSQAVLEALVICAESAIKSHNLDVAKKSLETYFLEARRYGNGLAAAEVRDQFLVRAHYATALLVSALSKGAKGAAVIEGTLEAIKHLMRGMEVAVANPRYTFLVYNGSVHHWHVARPLMRESLRTVLLPSMERVVAALERVPGQEAWKVRNLMNLALVQSEAGKAAEAASSLARGYAMARGAAAPPLPELIKEVARLQASRPRGQGQSFGGGGGGLMSGRFTSAWRVRKPAARPGARAPGPPNRRLLLLLCGGGKAAGAGGPLDEEEALRLVQGVMSGRPELAAAESQLRDAVSRVDPFPDGSAKAANLGPVSRAGWAAAVVGLPELAEKWAGRAAASQSSGPRNWSALTRVLLSLQALGGSDNTLARPVILVHSRALEALEDIVATFMKLGDVDGTHEAARLIWNASLLLLQPELRRHVKRAMNAAARALEVIDSPLHRLRAQLHLEAAKCDAMEDSLIKASQEVARAIGLDYPVSPREQAAHQLERPLDRFLLPLADTLALRMGAKEPDGVEQEALSMIERSKESRSPAIKTDLLRRALEKLSSLPLQPPPPPSTPPGPARAAAHLRARRRTAGWSELVKSAWSGGPAARSEELVLAAAPWALAGEWDAGVDREMVLLQGQVSYLEAEACVSMLKKMRREVVPPLQPPPLLQPPPGGLRPPALKPEEFQSTLIAAILRGMRAGLAISEPWLVVNGAVLTWNSYLPVMQQYRYAELSPVLTPVVDLLLRLDIPSSDGLLAVGLTEALAKSREHALLLTLLLPPPAPGRGEDGDDGEEGGGPAGEAGRAAGYAGPAFRSGVTAGYEPLPSARVKAGSQDPRSHPRTKRLMATLPSIAASCEQALARAGTAQSQSLFEAYARLQQLRGLPVAIPAGTAATSEQTSKVVGIIEAVLRSTSPTHASADIRAAMAILAALPTVNVELWAKLGRAAAGAQLYPLALECATSATRLLPEGQSLSSVTVATDLPLLPPNAWFWLAVAELTHGQAVMALADTGGGAHTLTTRLTLRRTALQHFADACRLACWVGKADLAEAGARWAWRAALPFMGRPLLRASIAAPLAHVADAVNLLGVGDVQFQGWLNCLRVECLASRGEWSAALAALDAGLRAMPPRSSHRPLLAWRALCLARLGRNLPAEMQKVKEYGPETQGGAGCVADIAEPRAQASTRVKCDGGGGRGAFACQRSAGWCALGVAVQRQESFMWSVLGHHSETRYDQLTSAHKALDAVAKVAWVRAEYLVNYAEWLISSGLNDGELAEDALLAAADALLEFDVGEVEEEVEVEEVDPTGRSIGSKMGRRSARRPSTAPRPVSGKRGGASARPHSSAPAEEAAQPDDCAPDSLSTNYLERLLRIYLMLALAADNAADHCDYLLTAQHYGVRILQSAMFSAIHTAQLKAGLMPNGLPAPGLPAAMVAAATAALPSANIPDTMAGWGTYTCAPELMALLREDSGAGAGAPMALNTASLQQPERTLAYLRLLAESLGKRGYDVQVLPLMQLARLVAQLVVKSESLYQVLTLTLVSQLDCLGMSASASRLEASLGDYTAITPSEEAAAAEDAAAHAMRQMGGVGAAAADAVQRAGGGGGGGSGEKPGGDGTASAAVTLTDVDGGAGSGPGPGGAPDWLVASAAEMLSGGGEPTSGGLMVGVRGLLVLRPLSVHDVWLCKGRALIARGHYGSGKALLLRAREHACHTCDSEAESAALLELSKAEALAQRHEEAVAFVQAAQRLGGDTDFWRDAVLQYVDCRLAGPHSTSLDAKEALQGLAASEHEWVRAESRCSRRSPGTTGARRGPPPVRGAALKLRLAQLLLGEMGLLRRQGVSTWKRNYDQALTLTQQAIAALAAREAGIPHVEALLLQAELLSADPAPARDVRPRLKKVERVLLNAEEMAARFQSECVPRDLDPAVVVPVSRLLARTRLALAELQLLQAAARDANRAADQARLRPKYPRMKGREDEVVVHYIDSISAAPATTVMQPEDSALALAASAAQLSAAPADRSRAHMLEGRCLLFKFLALAPSSIHPWPTPTPAASAASSDQQQQQQVIMLLLFVVDAQQLQQQPGAPGRQRGGGDGEGGACGGSDGEGEAGGRAAEAAALSVKRWAVASFEMALEVSLGQQFWLTAELTALELARCYGKMEPQTPHSAHPEHRSSLRTAVLVMAPCCWRPPPPQQAEALALQVRAQLGDTLVAPTDCGHYQKVRQLLSTLGTTAPQLDLAAAPPIPDILASLPQDLRILALYLAPDKCTLYMAAINVPNPDAPPPLPPAPLAGRREAAVTPPPAAVDASGSPVPSTVTLVERGHLKSDALERLVARLRAYRRQVWQRRSVEKTIRTEIASAALRGVGVPRTPEEEAAAVAAAAAAAKGARGAKKGAPARAVPAAASSTGRRGSAGSGGRNASKGGSGVDDSEDLPVPPIFSSELAAEWSEIVEQMEDLLEPWMPLLRSAFPAPPTDPPAAPAGMTPSPAASTGRKEAAPVFVKHKVVLLLDPALASLPFEALPWFRATASSLSRAPSLHLLHAASAPLRDAPPTDLTSTAYIVDPRSQCSTPLQARGPFMAPLAPAFNDTILAAFGAGSSWSGIAGVPGTTPAESQYASLLAGGSALIYFGLGRFLGVVPPRVIASLDLRGMDLVILMDRVNTHEAHQAQVYLDNRKSAAERELEGPSRAAELLLARGVKTVVSVCAATVPTANLAALASLLDGLSAGSSVGEAVWALTTGAPPHELPHLGCNLMVHGAPHLKCVLGAGKKGSSSSKKK
ncbi:MAG: hypothetical protein WDW36_004367 [Sanguina aurantia]